MCSCRSARWDKAAMRSSRMGLCAEQWQPKTMEIAEQPANKESAIEDPSHDHTAGSPAGLHQPPRGEQLLPSRPVEGPVEAGTENTTPERVRTHAKQNEQRLTTKPEAHTTRNAGSTGQGNPGKKTNMPCAHQTAQGTLRNLGVGKRLNNAALSMTGQPTCPASRRSCGRWC